jgi:hypothetical protein
MPNNAVSARTMLLWFIYQLASPCEKTHLVFDSSAFCAAMSIGDRAACGLRWWIRWNPVSIQHLHDGRSAMIREVDVPLHRLDPRVSHDLSHRLHVRIPLNQPPADRMPGIVQPHHLEVSFRARPIYQRIDTRIAIPEDRRLRVILPQFVQNIKHAIRHADQSRLRPTRGLSRIQVREVFGDKLRPLGGELFGGGQ